MTAETAEAPACTPVAFLAVDGAAVSDEDAIMLCGAMLAEAGCVTDAFPQSCIERERSYPTGICAKIPVALPHCKSEAIMRSALCYLRLEHPVSFRRMDDDQLTVSTRHVFNLAIAPGDHLEFLSKTMQLLVDDGFLERLETMDINEASAVLRAKLG